MKPMHEETHSMVQTLETSHHVQDIQRWLASPDPSTNYNKALRQRHPSSGQWFLQDTAYSAWKSDQNSFLWLYGIPGCGKTVLSSTIIEDLAKGGSSQSPLYFYFDFNEASKQSLDKAVRSLIIQLYREREDVRRHLDSLYSSCKSGVKQPSIDSLCKAFQDMVQQAGEAWIILDALDECQTRKDYQDGRLLPWVENLLGSRQTNIHLLVTSRPEQDIKSAIEKWARIQDIISIQSSKIVKDICSYVYASVRQHERLSRWRSRPEIQEEIETTLIEKSHGM